MKRQQFDSVWDAIEDSPAEAADMKLKSEVLIAIREVVASWKVTQAESCQADRHHPAAPERSTA
jgi:predicted XRE-type DNA-binding protein